MNESFILSDDNNYALINPGRHILPMASLDELDGDNLLDNNADEEFFEEEPWWMQPEQSEGE